MIKELMEMHYIQEMSPNEIAQRQGLPIGTVISRIARGRYLLKRQWILDKKLQEKVS